MTTGKTIALTRWTFAGRVMCLLFNVLSRLVIAFLPRSKHLLISWVQAPSAVIFEPPKIKSVTVSTFSPSIFHLFKQIRYCKGTFRAMAGSIKERNSMDLTEAEDIKKRWQEYTEELHKKRSS